MCVVRLMARDGGRALSGAGAAMVGAAIPRGLSGAPAGPAAPAHAPGGFRMAGGPPRAAVKRTSSFMSGGGLGGGLPPSDGSRRALSASVAGQSVVSAGVGVPVPTAAAAAAARMALM